MIGSDSGQGTAPQFETVEYESKSGKCGFCNQPLSGNYYRVNGVQACANCLQREQTIDGEARKNFPRAVLFGIGAAIVGMIGYAVFEIATGWIIGYVSIGVGWLVGKAMLKGSNGVGGRRYQITAVLLTYMAVSLAAIPVIMNQVIKQKKEHKQTSVATAPAPAPNAAGVGDQSQQAANSTPATTEIAGQNAPTLDTQSKAPSPATSKPRMSLGKALGMLLLIGLASPFLELADPFSGIIGLFILFLGMQIAWRMMRRPKLVVDGPF